MKIIQFTAQINCLFKIHTVFVGKFSKSKIFVHFKNLRLNYNGFNLTIIKF